MRQRKGDMSHKMKMMKLPEQESLAVRRGWHSDSGGDKPHPSMHTFGGHTGEFACFSERP